MACEHDATDALAVRQRCVELWSDVPIYEAWAGAAAGAFFVGVEVDFLGGIVKDSGLVDVEAMLLLLMRYGTGDSSVKWAWWKRWKVNWVKASRMRWGGARSI